MTRKLGEGGFGAVYLGQHPEIESKVAIKVLHPQFVTDAAMAERFLDEARAVNRIGHRGIVRIHDTGRLPEIGAYLVMEYLEGESLLDRLQHRGPLPVDQTVRFLMQACTALGACHRAGIVHRDLKPANMHIVADEDLPGGERVIILDFGIAKLVQQQDLGRATATGTLLGSPLYMSPEQCLDSKSVDHRSDIFSLGVVAYELLCGKCPFEADTLGQLVLKHSNEEPAPLRTLRKDLSPPLDVVVRRALERLPEDRHQSMGQLRRALEKAFFGEVSSSCSTTGPRRPMDVDAIGEAETIAPDSAEVHSHEPEAPADEGPPRSETEPALSSSTAAEVRSLGGGLRAGTLPGLAALLLLSGVGLYFGLIRETREGDRRPGDTLPSKQTPPAAPVTATHKQAPGQPPAPGLARPTRARITLDLTPATATAELDGQPVHGSALELPVDSRPRQLRISAVGYVSRSQPLVVDGPRTVRIQLERARRGGHPSTLRGKSRGTGKGRPAATTNRPPAPTAKPTKKDRAKKKLFFHKL